MKKILFVCLLLAIKCGYAQQTQFNAVLDENCKQALNDTVSDERKALLEDVAQQLVNKKYILFTCKTNSRRTLFLQAWAQTSFIYFGMYNKFAFSIGDTITQVYPLVVDVLRESGFSCTKMESGATQGYIISINEEIPANIILSKDDLGTIDTAQGVVVSICYEGEHSDIASSTKHVNLPYQSPTVFEGTPEENEKYHALNKQISAEMFYLSRRLKELIIQNVSPAKK